MKPLPKKENLQSLKAEQIRLEIEDGVKLSKKVDKLRQTHAEEEQKLEKFRSETTQRVKSEIDTLISRKDSLLSEVQILEDRRKQALIPVQEEWDRVNLEKTRLEADKNRLNEEQDMVNRSKLALNEEKSQLVIEEDRIKDLKQDAESDRRQASLLKDQAKDMALSAELKIKEADRYAQIKGEELTLREAKIASREIDIELAQKKLLADRKILNERARAIDDKYDTLLQIQQLNAQSNTKSESS